MSTLVSRNLAIAIVMTLLVSCQERGTSHAQEPHGELATYMGRLQVFSQKLGYSVAAKNVDLCGFYLHEIEETVEEIAVAVPKHDGHDIAGLVNGLMMPAVSQLKQTLDRKDWTRTRVCYESLITSCNTCHQATSHGFIRILPASGPSPFNQQFELSMPAKPK